MAVATPKRAATNGSAAGKPRLKRSMGQKQEPVAMGTDPDALFLCRARTPPPKRTLAAPHDDIERTPIGLGLD